MRKPGFFLLLLFILTNASAQKATDYRKQQNYKEWVHIAPKFDDDFFKTEEAQRIGDNVLLYQQITGGWPKNIYMPAELTEQEYKAALKAKEDINQSTGIQILYKRSPDRFYFRHDSAGREKGNSCRSTGSG